jgi:hypothetical protein
VGVLVKPTAAAVERLALQSPAELLAGRTAHLQELYKLSGCSQHQFDQVYGSLLTAFAGYVQALPAVTDPKTTLLDERLRAAERVLFRRRAVLLPVGETVEASAQAADLWTYLVFCLALLYRLGRDLDAWHITLWTADATPLGHWSPAVMPRGLLAVHRVTHYTVQPAPIRVTPDWTGLVAGALMPAVGLNWLWRDAHAMAFWTQAIRADLPDALCPLFVDVPFAWRACP